MTAVLRITPPMLRDVRRPQRMVERNIVAYRRQWIVLLSGFFEPLFYLLSMRVGLGQPDRHCVGRRPGGALRPLRRAGVDGRVGDERRRVRLDHERVPQDEVGADLRRSAGDTDVSR